MAEVFGQATNTWGTPNKGSFSDPIFKGVGTDTFNWAESVDPALPTNGLSISSLPFDVSFNKPFEVGMLSYFNGSIWMDTAVESVPLQIQLDLDSPTDQTKNFKFDLKLETVADCSPDPEDWKDFVYFPDVLPNETFDYGGKKYTLEVLGFSKDGGTTLENRFRVQEQEADSAGLYAKITEVKKQLPDGDKNAQTDGATLIGDIKKKAWVETEDIGYTEGGVRDVSDLYKFSIKEQCEVSLVLDQLAQNADLEILDSDGTTVLFQSTETGARTKELITEILEAGDYYVRVYTPGSQKTKYRLSVKGESITEEKDSLKTAKDLGVLSAQQVTELDKIGFGAGKSRDAQDFYKFSVTEDKNDVQIILDGLKADANIELYDSDGKTKLGTSDNKNRNADKIVAELDKGEYYIKVIPQGNAKTDYQLTVNSLAIKDEPDDKAPGVNLGTLTPANAITKADKIGAKVGSGRDQKDYYTFDVPDDTNIYLTLGGLKANAKVQLFDESGDEIDTSTGKAGVAIEQTLEKGTYTVLVTPDGQSSTDYQLKISAEAPFVDDYPIPKEALDLGAVSGKKVFNNEIGKTQGRAGRDEKDWIKFDVTKESWVDINLDKLRQNADLELYDGDGKTLLNYSRETGQRAAETIQDVLEPGTYYLQVVPKVSGRTGYQLSVDISDLGNKVQKFEVGDLNTVGTYSKPESIGLGAADRRNELDQYSFSLDEKTDVVINLDDLTADANIRLKTSQGVLLFDSTNSGDSSEEISENLDAGDYVLEVFPFGNAKANYNLSMSAAGGGVDDDSPASLATDMTNILNADKLYSTKDNIGSSIGSTSRDQKDYYSFTLTGEEAVSIKLSGLSGNANVELLDSDESPIRASRNPGKAAESISETLEAGKYYVLVTPQGSDRTDYDLSVSLGGSGGKDSDGTFPTATNIGGLGDYEASDSIGLQGDGYRDINDYRKFTISEKSNFSLNLTNLKQNADVELYDADQVLLKSSRKSGQADESISDVLTKGDYYVRVLPKGSVGSSYDLNMSASPVGQDSSVDLGTLGADPLTNKGLSGETGDPVDEFTFIVGSGGFVDINLTGLKANANLEVYSKAGVLIGSSANAGNSNENINSFLSPDTYLVKVLASGGLTPYNLEVVAG
ncbi:peptidase-like protein [Planktothrix agardhii NIES-204]|nr:peptidase-like protein [Planktothrix agardhii NIES-204]